MPCLKDVARTAGAGRDIGKGELLRHSGGGLMSACINAKNRLIYKVDGDILRAVSCRGHYGNKRELPFSFWLFETRRF